MRYDLSLDIGSDYAHPVANGRHVLRIVPAELSGRQHLEAVSLTIAPEPESRRDFTGFFGGAATGFAIRHPHPALHVRLKARVEVHAPKWHSERAILLQNMTGALAAIRSVAPDMPHHFLAASPRLPRVDEAIHAYARESLDAGPDVFSIARSLMNRIHADFRYDAKATTVDTPAEQAFALKRGVCQDFTHIMIAGLRSLGIPAGYVSGYLRTLPPPGKPKLVGADAMHAWARAWCGPDAGWIEFDPTNRMLASDDHIVAGHGRDYADIAPLAGTVKAYGAQDGYQRVDIALADPGEKFHSLNI